VEIFEVTTASVTLSADSAYDILNSSGQVIASKNAGENFVYNIPANQADAFAKIVPHSSSAIVEAVSYEDHPSWNPSLNYNQFRGTLEIVYSPKSAKVLAVNELMLEDYLKGVAETNQGLAMEYLKTMSVAARTYAYHYEQLGGKYGVDEVYDITNTTADQLYKGYSREAYASDIVTAADATFGEIATYKGASIVTAYSSGAPELLTSGSRSACSVWGGKYCQPGYEYLAGGVKDPVGTTYSYDACGGGNHCVGLSGAGTRQLAALGKTYQEILKYYYPGIVIQKLY
jgi:peptidoglycan hydrolase-like amidase